MKKKKSTVESGLVRRRGQPAWRMANDQIALCWLQGGGHLESLSRRAGTAPNTNLLWEAPWQTIDPQRYSQKKHAQKYGAPPAGQFLAGFTGHALCVDYFGAPSEEETQLGLPLHGEIASSRWKLGKTTMGRTLATMTMHSAAPSAGFRVQRDITLRKNESVAFVTETIANTRNCDRHFQWVQHATFGPPFLQAGESVCVLPGTRSKTWPLGYEGKCALANDREFTWPQAPAEAGGVHDISRPFIANGRGFVAATLLAAGRDSQFAFVAVLNWRLNLLAGYFFQHSDFPWVAIWEENCARAEAPWNGKTQARGLEFGSSPLPLGLHEAIMTGPLFGTPTIRCLPARGSLKASYAIFATEVPSHWRTISGIASNGKAIVVTGPSPADKIELGASGLAEIWPQQSTKGERQKNDVVPQGGSQR